MRKKTMNANSGCLLCGPPDQFILTAGLHWSAPMGSKEIFQGIGSADLAPYITVGKECGDYHFLGTVGYQFPCGSADATVEYFFTTLHLDRRCFGWLYPLVELNWVAHTATVNVNGLLNNHEDFFDLGTFASSGNLVALSVGTNAVLIPERLEFGGAYSFPIASQHGFDFNGLLVKMVYRF